MKYFFLFFLAPEAKAPPTFLPNLYIFCGRRHTTISSKEKDKEPFLCLYRFKGGGGHLGASQVGMVGSVHPFIQLLQSSQETDLVYPTRGTKLLQDTLEEVFSIYCSAKSSPLSSTKIINISQGSEPFDQKIVLKLSQCQKATSTTF